MTEIPDLVTRATAAGERAGFTRACTPEVGRLLQLPTCMARSGTIAEFGAGYGAGAAWIASALAPGVSFVTVESDAARARATSALLAGVSGTRVIHADWRVVLEHGPFALIFVDIGEAKHDDPEAVLAALAPGGLLLLDDLTPPEQWPPAWRGRPDPVRDYWLQEPRLHAVELRLSPTGSVILGVRRN